MAGPAHFSHESHSLRGAIARKALITIRDLYTSDEPLATADLDYQNNKGMSSNKCDMVVFTTILD